MGIMKTIASQAKAQGIGRYPKETVLKMANEDLEVLSLALGEKNFIFGDEPTELDCTLFAFLVLYLDDFLCKPKNNEDDTKEGEEENSKKADEPDVENKYKNLQSYIPRMKERFWSDWDDLCKEAEEAMAKKEKAKKSEDKEAEDTEDAKEIGEEGATSNEGNNPEGNEEEKKDKEK